MRPQQSCHSEQEQLEQLGIRAPAERAEGVKGLDLMQGALHRSGPHSADFL
jgi:hypothetical protein